MLFYRGDFYGVCYFTEEILTKQRQEALSNVEKQKSIINTLTNKNTALRQEGEHINLEIRCELLAYDKMYSH